MNYKKLEGSGRGQIDVLSWHLSGRNEEVQEKPGKTGGGQTEQLWRSSRLKCSRHATLLGDAVQAGTNLPVFLSFR
jgi:hypothetical protein